MAQSASEGVVEAQRVARETPTSDENDSDEEGHWGLDAAGVRSSYGSGPSMNTDAWIGGRAAVVASK